MIFNLKTKYFQTRSDKPNSNWLNDNEYIVIPDGSYLANKIMSMYPDFECILDEEGNLIDVKEIIDIEKLKEEKIKELEAKVEELKEKGFMYQGKTFKLDALAQDRINKLATGVALGMEINNLNWITRNGEEGVYTIVDNNDFKGFYSNATVQIMNIEEYEAYTKLQIEQATTEEELNAIVIE